MDDTDETPTEPTAVPEVPPYDETESDEIFDRLTQPVQNT